MRSRMLFAMLLPALVLATAACGGDDDDDDGDTGVPLTSATAIPNDAGPAPRLEGPASLYSISQDNLGPGYITDIEYTWVLDADSYGNTTPFRDVDGPAMLRDWGYVAGYETSYTPEGRSTAVLNGAYWIFVETHLMESEEGAKELFAFFKEYVDQTVSEPITAHTIGNESAAWRAVNSAEPIGQSTVPSENHRFFFRRGNLVGAVQTVGAEPFMDVTTAYRLAHIIDQKALGEIELIEPTPVTTVASD